ncbi:MAG: GNAT family N-acetyltransferase [Thermoplasmata archaeon]|nr:GNAT family N-acetyltransferase [Thermoplasmata archaeon]
MLRRLTPPVLVKDRERVRAFLDDDPVGNAIVWDRVFQQAEYRVYAEGDPIRGVLAVQPSRRSDGPSFFSLHALDADAAGALCDLVPSGRVVFHLTEEFPLSFLEPRASEFLPEPAWLFRVDARDLVGPEDPRVRPLEPRWAGLVAKLWQPDWPADGYVRRRIEGAPTAAIYEAGEPVAWALTHVVTDRVGIIGMVHVREDHRRGGLARSVVAAITRELLRRERIPALHAIVDNTASLALFPSLGFRQVKRQVWGEAVLK